MKDFKQWFNEKEFETDLGYIIKGDCLEKMKNITDKSIDMILCDLPSATTQNKWDCLLDLDKLWLEYDRIIKDNGVICLSSSDIMFTYRLIDSLLKAKIKIKRCKYDIIWEKNRPSGFLNAKRMPLKSHESMLIFYKKQPVYNPQMVEGKPSHSIGKVKGENHCKNNSNYGEFSRVEREGKLKYPRTVWKYERPHPPIHPTQKSDGLWQELIKTYTNEGDLVLDNTAGVMTTGVNAELLHRRWINIEKDEDNKGNCLGYIEKGIKRFNI